MESFVYKFSMESVGNFKVEFQLNPDTTFSIVRNNYFFDKFEGKNRPMKIDGVLNEAEFDTFEELISESNIHKLKDSYGFSDNENSDNSIIYIIELTQKGKSKFVTINSGTTHRFSDQFTELINYTSSFINKERE